MVIDYSIYRAKFLADRPAWMLFPVWPRRTFSNIICYLPSGPTGGRFVVAVMADIRAGVEAKTAVEDLSAKSFPRYG